MLPDATSIRAVLLDIEGTTTPIDFVYKVLFPYASERMMSFLRRHFRDPEIRPYVAELTQQRQNDLAGNPSLPRSQASSDSEVTEIASYARWLISRDVKLPALKALQGKIWEEGYRNRELKGEVYSDVPRGMERWKRQGRGVYIYSSGSVLAQRLLFQHSTYGDLSGSIKGYFDLDVGSKQHAGSYREIAAKIPCEAREVLFLSDVVNELECAKSAGMQTALVLRGKDAKPTSSELDSIRSFDEVFPEKQSSASDGR